MLGTVALYSSIAVAMVLALMVSVTYILAITGLVPFQHWLFKPVNWLTDLAFRIDGKLERITFRKGPND